MEYYVDEHFYNELLPNIIVPIGLPGSGKSYLYNKLFKDKYIKISFDDILLELTKKENNYKEAFKYATETGLIKEALRLFNSSLENFALYKANVFIDTTNIKKEHRENLLNIFKNYNFIYIVFDYSFEFLEKRNKKRAKEGKDLDSEVIKNLYKNFTKPSLHPYALIIYYDNNINELKKILKSYNII